MQAIRNFVERYRHLIPNIDLGYIVLLMLFLINAIYTFMWLRMDTVPPSWDSSNHLRTSILYYRLFPGSGPTGVSLTSAVGYYIPPFYFLSTGIMYMFFGTSMDTAIMTNVIFFGVLLFSTYGIGKKLFSNEIGLIAAILVSLYPSIFAFQREYMLELPLVAMVALSIYALLLTDNFNNFRYSIAFGVISALGMLTKWTFPLFVIGPLACVIYSAFASESIKDNIKGVGNLICSGAIAVFLSSIWYLPQIGRLQTMLGKQAAIGAVEGDPQIFTLESFLYHFFSLIDFHLFIFFFIIFVIGVAFFVLSKYRSKLFLFSWIMIPYIAHTLFRNKDPRYFMPALVSIALISALWISSIEGKKLKAAAFSVVLIVGGLQLCTMPMGIDSVSQAMSIDAPYHGQLRLYPYPNYGARPPRVEDWKIVDVLEEIRDDIGTNTKPQVGLPICNILFDYPVVAVIPDHGFINGYTFLYHAIRERMPFYVLRYADISSTCQYRDFSNFDYLILKTGDMRDSVVDIYSFFYVNYNDNYTLLGEYAMPDNSTLSIYENVRLSGFTHTVDAEAYNNLGMVYLDAGWYNKATAEFKEALRINPDYIDAHYNLGIAYWHTKQYDLARQEWEKVLEIDPNFEVAKQKLRELEEMGY